MTQSKQQDKIQEIMRAVEYYNCETMWGTTEQQMAARAAIESKLRELVREPLGYEAAKELIDSCKDDDPMFLLRNVELAHGITNASGEV